MSCETIDLKEYFFGEASRDDSRRVEQHLEACAGCREELSRLQLTQAALGALRDEELPRRIAFVSDKVFEPRWYQRLWNSGPQLGFLAASLLAGAILVHAFVPRPMAAPTGNAPAVVTASVDQAAMEREIARRVDVAVTKAVADSESRHEQKTIELIKTYNHQREMDRREILTAVSSRFEFIQKAMSRDYAMATGLGSGQ